MKMLQGANCQTRIKMLTVFLSYLVWPTYAFKFTAKNSRDSSGIFIKCTYLTLECLHEPYSNVHSWKYNSAEVALCLFDSCVVKTNNSGFKFEFDTANGIFRWIINPTEDEYQYKVFECSDGTIKKTMNLTIPFQEAGWKSQNFAILIAVVIFFNSIAVLGTALYNRNIFCSDQHKLKSDKNLGQPNYADNTSQKVRSNCRQTFFMLCFPLGFFIVGVLLTVSLILATRFNNGSVLEEYVKICCWEILLIFFGIYVILPGVPLLMLAIVIKRKLDSKTALASGSSHAIEMNADGEDRGDKFAGKPRNGNGTGTDSKRVELTTQQLFLAKPELPRVNIYTKTDGRNINIWFCLKNDIPNVLTTVCFNTDGIVTDLTEQENNTESDEILVTGTQQKRILPLPLHVRTPSTVQQYDYPLWIKNKNTTYKVLKFSERHYFSVVKNSIKEIPVTVFVYWTTKDYKFLAKSEDLDYTKDINTKNEFKTDICPDC